jgi:hypothetical protein
MDYTIFEENSDFFEIENNYFRLLFETCKLNGFSDKTFKAYYFVITRYFRFIHKSSLNMNLRTTGLYYMK